MMTKNRNKIKILAVIVLIAFGSSVLFYDDGKSPFAEVQIFSVSNPTGTENTLFVCKAWVETTDRGINNEVSAKQYNTSNDFLTSWLLSITSQNSRIGELAKINTQLHTACELNKSFSNLDVSDFDFRIVGAEITQVWKAQLPNGSTIHLSTLTKTIDIGSGRNVLYDNKDTVSGVTVIGTSITGTAIDNKLTSTVADYSVKITIDTTAKLIFKSTQSSNIPSVKTVVLHTSKYVDVHNQSIDQPQPKSNEIRLFKITAGSPVFKSWNSADAVRTSYLTFDIKNYGFTTVPMKVEVVLPEWTSAEGKPTLIIRERTDTGAKIILNKQVMTTALLFSSTNNQWKFSTTYIFPINNIEGFYWFEVNSNNDVRKQPNGAPMVALWNMKILKSGTTITPTPTGEGVTSANAFYGYNLKWSNGDVETGQTNDFRVGFGNLSLLKLGSSDEQRKLQSMQLATTMDLTGKSVTSGKITAQDYSYSILVDGKTVINKKQFSVQLIDKGVGLTADKNTFIFATVRGSVEDLIIKPLKNIGYGNTVTCTVQNEKDGACKFFPDGTNVTFKMFTTASVNLTSGGETKRGIMSGLTYTLNLEYSSSITQEDCQGLTGQPLLTCKGDADNDGVYGEDDKCPTIQAFTDDGCPESKDYTCWDDSIVTNPADCPENPEHKKTCWDGSVIAQVLSCPPPHVEPIDSDNDGILDSVDQCPFQAGTIENNGCPSPPTPTDSDGDGIDDDVDQCPSVIGIREYNGCPAPKNNIIDTDKDGFTDDVDECPFVAGIVENNGCPDSTGFTGDDGGTSTVIASGLCGLEITPNDCINLLKKLFAGESNDMIMLIVVLLVIVVIIAVVVKKRRQ